MPDAIQTLPVATPEKPVSGASGAFPAAAPTCGTCDTCGRPVAPERLRRGARRCSPACAREADSRRKGYGRTEASVVPAQLRAALSLAVAEGDLVRRGWLTYRATAPGGPADLIAHRDGRWLRVRVRTGRADARGRVTVPADGSADVIAVVVPDGHGVDRIVYAPRLEEVLE